MTAGSDYDGEVQMFVQRPREIDPAHLRFLRWLAVRGYLEHTPIGPPYGVYAGDDVAPAPTESGRPGTAHPKRSDLTLGIGPDTEEHLP